MKHAITLSIDGQRFSVEQGVSVAAAIALAAEQTGQRGITRQSVSAQPRAPLCGMGVCQECRVTIDGRQHQLACQTLCADDMDVRTAAQEFAA